MMQKIEQTDSYHRTHSGAIVNTNMSAYDQFIQRKKDSKALENRIVLLEQKLDLILDLLESKK
jgi:hypothetical protein